MAIFIGPPPGNRGNRRGLHGLGPAVDVADQPVARLAPRRIDPANADVDRHPALSNQVAVNEAERSTNATRMSDLRTMQSLSAVRVRHTVTVSLASKPCRISIDETRFPKMPDRP